MEIEEQLPERSSFGRVLAVVGLFLLCFLVGAWFMLHKDSSKIVPGRYDKHPVSHLQMPEPAFSAQPA